MAVMVMAEMMDSKNNFSKNYYVAADKRTADLLISAAKLFAETQWIEADFEIVYPGEMKITDLPENVQNDIMGTLRAYRQCNVWYEDGRFHAMASCGCKSSYSADHFFCGTYIKEKTENGGYLYYNPEMRVSN